MIKKSILAGIILCGIILFTGCEISKETLTDVEKEEIAIVSELVSLDIKNISNEDMPASLKDETLTSASASVDTSFEEEDGVRGDAYQRLMDIINEQEIIDEAKSRYDEVTTFFEENKEKYVMGESVKIDDNASMYFETQENLALIEVKRNITDTQTNLPMIVHVKVEKNLLNNLEHYKITTILDRSIDDKKNIKISIVEFNEDMSVRKEEVRYTNTESNINRTKVLHMQKQNGVMKLAAKRIGQNKTFELSAYASDQFGAVFSSMEITNSNSNMINGKTFAKEFYNGEGALVKQGFGTQQLDKIIRFMPSSTVLSLIATNIYNIIQDSNVGDFTVEFPLTGAPILKYGTEEYILPTGIEMIKNYAFYNMQGENWGVGDKVYAISESQVGIDSRILTFKSVFEVPEAVEAINGEYYYYTDRYIAKYIKAEEGYELQTDGQKYFLTNTLDLTDSTQYVIPIIKTKANEFFKGYNTPANNVSLVQLNQPLTSDYKIIFTQSEIVEKAELEVGLIYTEMLPTSEEINNIFLEATLSKIQ